MAKKITEVLQKVGNEVIPIELGTDSSNPLIEQRVTVLEEKAVITEQNILSLNNNVTLLAKKVNPDNKTIEFNNTEEALKVIIEAGGGLAVHEDGNGIYVDFSQMPTDKFEALLKSIRVPIWLTANKNFYVNGTTGSDTLDDGRGESEGKPFKTIQACVNYVCDNYNLSRYIAKIIIEDGEYDPFEVTNFSYTTGYISINPKNKATINVDFSNTNLRNTYGIKVSCGGRVDINNFLINVNATNEEQNLLNFDVCGINQQNGYLYIKNVEITISIFSNKGIRSFANILCSNNSFLYIIEGNKLKSNSNTDSKSVKCIIVSYGATITLSNIYSEDKKFLTVSGEYTEVLWCVNGIFSRGGTTQPIIIDEGTTGKRFVVQNGGKVNTNGAGPEFFPGDTPGTVESSTYSWYK